jgi:hypothetical protein
MEMFGGIFGGGRRKLGGFFGGMAAVARTLQWMEDHPAVGGIVVALRF